MEIITNRPKGMSFIEYKASRRESNEKISRYIKYGRVYYVAAEIISTRNSVGAVIGERYARYEPFVGSARYDLRKPV